MEPVTIPLSAPVEWHKTMVKEIAIKPPGSGTYLRLGEPRIPVRNADGTFYWVEKDEVIRNYVEDMVDHEGGVQLIALVPFIDAKRVRDAVLSFFDQAAAIIYAPKSAPSSST